MKLFMIMSLMISLLVMVSTHPIILVFLISAQSLAVAFLINYTFMVSWFSLILFLVFMGGLMVLFIYISSLASNEKFTQNKIMQLLMICISMTLSVFLSLSFEFQENKFFNPNQKVMIFKMYSMNNTHLIFLTMIYLLIVLIVSVSIISMHEGPIRSILK